MPSDAIDLICEFEGFRSDVYTCGSGVATIGFGSTFYEDGMPVEYGDSPIDELTARRMMLNIAKTDFWDVIRVRIPYWNEMTQGHGVLCCPLPTTSVLLLRITRFRHYHPSLKRQGMGRSACCHAALCQSGHLC